MRNAVLVLIPGVAEGMLLLLIASGLTLTFGTMRLVNMAHGGFFMIGAYVLTAVDQRVGGGIGFLVGCVVAIAAMAGLGMLAERLVYRRFYGADPMSGLLGSFALLLVFQGAVIQIWTSTPRGVSLPTAIAHASVRLAGVGVAAYDVVVIIVAGVVMTALGLWLAFGESGLKTRVVAADRDMVEILGISARSIFLLMFALGSALAGLAGALIAPTLEVDPNLGGDYIVLAFAVVLMGGLGSAWGTVVACLAVGLADAFVNVYVPALAGYGIWLVLIAVLVLRPGGLRGSGEAIRF